jgi:hypothetical protein
MSDSPPCLPTAPPSFLSPMSPVILSTIRFL